MKADKTDKVKYYQRVRNLTMIRDWLRGNYIFTSEIHTRLWKQGLDSYSLCFLSSLTRFLKGKIQYIKQIISQLYTSARAHTHTHGAQNAAKGRLWLWNWHYLFSSHSCTVQRHSRNHQVHVFRFCLFLHHIAWQPPSDFAAQPTI